jgi:hypothetical protein
MPNNIGIRIAAAKYSDATNANANKPTTGKAPRDRGRAAAAGGDVEAPAVSAGTTARIGSPFASTTTLGMSVGAT